MDTIIQKDKIKQIFGYIILIIGIILILISVYFSWKIFSGKINAPEVFKEGVISKEKNVEMTPTQDINELQKQAVNKVSQDVVGAFDAYMPRTLNLFSWSLFAWIMITAGFKIATIGKELI